MPKRHFGIVSTLKLGDDIDAVRDMVRTFSREQLLPHSLKWDRERIFPEEQARAAAALGLLGIYVPEKLGGAGQSRLAAAVIFEELAYSDISFAGHISVHNMVNWVISQNGSQQQKEELCPRLSRGEWFASYCLTEPNSGSDSAAMQTKAVLDGSHYVVNGSKVFITGGSVSQVYLVFCKTGEKEVSAIIVPKDTPGLSFGKPEDKMGWHSSPTTTVSFDNVRVPKENLVSTPGAGFRMAMNGLNGGRVNIAACSVGGAQLALDKAMDYVKERKQFGKALAEFQHTQFTLAELQTRVVASRLMLYEAARALDTDDPDKVSWAAMAKLFATDECFAVADRCLQMFGGYGYLRDYGVEKIVRDLRVNRILEGTNEIMKLVISRNMLK